MDRRQFNLSSFIGLITLAAWVRNAHALSLGDISGADASSGLKAALEKGALSAVGLLGVANGFMGNDLVRIALPGYLNDTAQLLKKFGQGKEVDELVLGMNRAAESAVPLAKDLLVDAVKTMSVADAKTILQGGNTAATSYFSSKTREPLGQKFLPIITQATAKVGLADKYNAVAGKAAGLGLIKAQDASLENYVNGKALDGLFLMIGEEEKKIRQDPIGTGSALLSKVFGALK
jgi:Protein of unknown function (DUF4197)